jgi:hypothetical protein
MGLEQYIRYLLWTLCCQVAYLDTVAIGGDVLEVRARPYCTRSSSRYRSFLQPDRGLLLADFYPSVEMVDI